jgi:hypothetical protein
MTGVHIIAMVAALVTLTVIFELSRRRQLHVKYIVIWLLVAIIVAVFAITPGLFNEIAHKLGVKSPPDLLLVLASLFLLMICVHLSWEAGRLEDKTRILAEEVALLQNQLEEQLGAAGISATGPRLPMDGDHRISSTDEPPPGSPQLDRPR